MTDMARETSVAAGCLAMTGLFESEVLLRLLLVQFDHPSSDDDDFNNDLLEQAAIILRKAVNGEPQVPGLPAPATNFIAAIWEAERRAISATPRLPQREARRQWLETVRRTFPSCFVPPDDLPS